MSKTCNSKSSAAVFIQHQFCHNKTGAGFTQHHYSKDKGIYSTSLLHKSGEGIYPAPLLQRKSGAGFTLMELLLYAAILAIIGVSMTGFFSEMYDYYYNVQIKSTVTQNLRYASQSIQQLIRQSQSITTASGTTLILAMTDASQNPTEFGLDTGTGKLYKKIAGGNMVYITPDSIEVTNVSFSRLSSNLTKALNPNQWAWSGGASSETINEGIGWVDFNPSSSDVRIPVGAGDFLGMAYIPASNDYINLNCVTTDSCSDVSYKVYADASGTLHGWAWSDAYGWFSFNSAETTSTVPYSVSINQTTGSFSGYAWSENIGWLSFNCSNTSSCGTISYLVKANNQQATPVNTVNISLTMKYRSLVPKFQYTDTYTLSVPALPVSAVRITSISPTSSASTVSLTISGTGFAGGASAKLSRSGFADAFPTTDCVFVSSTSLQSCAFDVTDKQKGVWDVVVTNPDGQMGILPAGFTVQ